MSDVDITPTPAAPAPPLEEKLLPQSQVNAIVAREKAALAAQRDELAARAKAAEERLAAIDAEAAAKAEASMTQAQREANERKREREALEAKASAAEKLVLAERQRRRDGDVGREAARRVAGVAGRLLNPELSDDVADLVTRSLVIEETDGKEQLLLKVEGELVPYNDDNWKRFEATRLSRYFRGESGSGGPHGAGNGGPRAAGDWKSRSPLENIAAGIAGNK